MKRDIYSYNNNKKGTCSYKMRNNSLWLTKNKRWQVLSTEMFTFGLFCFEMDTIFLINLIRIIFGARYDDCNFEGSYVNLEIEKLCRRVSTGIFLKLIRLFILKYSFLKNYWLDLNFEIAVVWIWKVVIAILNWKI